MSNSNGKGWTPTKLGDEIDLLTGFPFQSKHYVEDAGAIKLLRGDNVVQGQLRWDGAKRWPEGQTQEVEQYQLQTGDVVLAMDRPWIEAGLKYAAISEHDVPCLLVQRVARLRGRENLDTGFLRYLIGSAAFTQHILAVQTGTAVPHISGGQIKEFRFNRPPIKEQRGIAEVLRSLDDKIEANRRLNRTLEGIARAVFRSWFVDFDPVRAKADGRTPAGLDPAIAALFPDRFEDSALGPIPAGWLAGTIDDLVDGHREMINPGDRSQKIFLHYSIPAFDEGQMPKPEAGRDIKSNKFSVAANSVLVSKLNPSIPRIWLPQTHGPNSICSTEFVVLTPKGERLSREFLYCLFRSEEVISEFSQKASGTSNSHQRVKLEDVMTTQCVIPSHQVSMAWAKLFAPLFARIAANREQSQKLAAIRDVLLPKLISGEVRAPA